LLVRHWKYSAILSKILFYRLLFRRLFWKGLGTWRVDTLFFTL